MNYVKRRVEEKRWDINYCLRTIKLKQSYNVLIYMHKDILYITSSD